MHETGMADFLHCFPKLYTNMRVKSKTVKWFDMTGLYFTGLWFKQYIHIQNLCTLWYFDWYAYLSLTPDSVKQNASIKNHQNKVKGIPSTILQAFFE